MKNNSEPDEILNPHATVRTYHGFAYDRVRYTTLTCAGISTHEKEAVLAAIKPLVSGLEASEFALKNQNGWTYEFLDLMGRVGVLKWRGIEVALFFKRQLTEVVPEPPAPTPVGVLQDPIDAWQRLDILGSSAKQANLVLRNRHIQLEESNQVMRLRIDALEHEVAEETTRAAILGNDKWKLEQLLDPPDKIFVKRSGIRYVSKEKAKEIRARIAAREKKRKAKAKQ